MTEENQQEFKLSYFHKLIVATLAPLVLLIFSYLISAFIIGSWNANEWLMIQRGTMIFAWLLISFFVEMWIHIELF